MMRKVALVLLGFFIPMLLCGVCNKIGEFSSSGWKVSVEVFGNIAYLIDKDNGLQIIDVTDPEHTHLMGSYNTPGWALDVSVNNDIAVIANGYQGLILVDVSDLINPSLLGTYNTPGYARSVFVDGTTAYVADTETGVQIVDISNPRNPAFLGVYSTPGISIFSVFVLDNIAYAADATRHLKIINVTNPSSPTLISSYNTPGRAYSVAVSGSIAYVVDDSAGLLIVDVSNSNDPVFMCSYDTHSNPRGTNYVTVSGNIAYVTDGYVGLHILDISNPNMPTLLGVYDSNISPACVFVQNGIAYIAGGGMDLVDISDLSNAGLEGSNITPGEAVSIMTIGDLAYVACRTTGLHIIDVSNINNPVLLGSYDTNPPGGSGETRCVAVSDNIAYITNGQTLFVVDVANPSIPHLLGSCSPNGAAAYVAVSGHFAYVVSGLGGLSIYDVSTPSIPTFLSQYIFGSEEGSSDVTACTIVGNTIYVVDSYMGLHILDISNPNNPILLGTYSTYGLMPSVVERNGIAYVVCNDGVQIIEVTNPSNPVLLDTFKPHATSYLVSVYINGDRLYVSDVQWNEITCYDISVPQTPTLVNTNDRNLKISSMFVKDRLLYTANYYYGMCIIDLSLIENYVLDVPVDLEITRINNDIFLNWHDVTQYTNGQLTSPDYYRVFYSYSPLGPFFELGISSVTQYTHEGAASVFPSVFYQVTAVKN